MSMRIQLETVHITTPALPLYIGIDPSLNATGIAVVQHDMVVAHKTISPPKGVVGIPRLRDCRDQLKAYLGLLCNPVAGIMVEGYSFGSHNRQHHIGEWGGVLRLALYEWGYQVYSMPPTSLKKYATGKGNAAGKAPMVMAAYRMSGLDLSSAEDEADAVLLAYALRSHLYSGATKVQLEALKKVEKLPVLIQPRPARVRSRGA